MNRKGSLIGMGIYNEESVFAFQQIGSITKILSEEFNIVSGEKICILKLGFNINGNKYEAEISYLMERSSDYRLFRPGDKIGFEFDIISRCVNNKEYLIVKKRLLHKIRGRYKRIPFSNSILLNPFRLVRDKEP